MQTIIFVAGW